jgi:cholesterol transport system auxiliary component
MMHRALARPLIARLAALAALAALGACVTLFPKTAPAQLYRFEANVQPPASAPPSTAIREGMLEFDPASAGDRILTVTGDQVGYMDIARWAVPASQLFEAAVARGFDAYGTRLVGIGEASQAKYRLRLQVTHFEARYLNGAAAAPTVFVTMRATVDRQSDGTLVAERPFEASVEASDNRVGAIVQAYDAATSKVVGDLVAWVGQTAV